ncbi:peptidase s41 family protein [Zymoseptoria brevis]|uniref:Peptidase s41 family protein n=1 Tax=Zymoseptoria brevis TaxID=1047168 RepID=A0A0F4GIE5_9PEZI|nr:peptidase s41 family protein [Zymoseptoria brevis]
MQRLLTLALASLVAATPPTLHARQDSSPCAQLSSAYDDFVSADLALACLRSVPLRSTEILQSQLAGLRTFIEFQSDLNYLNANDIAARLYPPIDLLGGLTTLEGRLNDTDFYDNEYDFQLDVARLFASAYDGHLVYIPDIVGVFGFRRAQNGVPFNLISVSSDGGELPEVYAARDVAALSAEGSSDLSPISEINGGNVQDYLIEQAALTGSFHDPDANYNQLFARPLSDGYYEDGNFAAPGILFEKAGDTTLVFRNGSEQVLQTIARSNVTGLSLQGLTDGESLFERCCSQPSELRGIYESAFSNGEATEELMSWAKTRTGSQVAVHHPRHPLVKRQADDSLISPGFPQPSVNTSDGSLIGYFAEFDDELAILVLPTFAVGVTDIATLEIDLAVVDEYVEALASFLDEASADGRSRLIIDLRGNGGGLGYLPHEIFRQLFPSASLPSDLSNFRAHPLFNLIGSTVTPFYTTSPSADLLSDLRPSFGTFGFDSTQHLDLTNSSFTSWRDFYGPVSVPSLQTAQFTKLSRPNYTDAQQTAPIYLTRLNTRTAQVFSAENIILLQDGACASACALFSEFLKSAAPDGPVRQVVLGGRPQTGPMQSVGGIKGGQLGSFEAIALLAGGGATLTPISAQTFAADFGPNTIENALQAVDRAVPGAAAVNYRNSIRMGDESVTPLQYLYEAADCRLWYTVDMLASQEVLWRKVAAVGFDGDERLCVEGSTGHPSSTASGEGAMVDVPENARSEVGVRIGEESRAGAGPGSMDGGSDSGGDGDNEEGTASTARASLWVLVAAFAFAVLLG